MQKSLSLILASLFLAAGAPAQNTAFTYQGRLNDNSNPADGTYDFRFRLFDAGSNVVAGPLTNAPVGVTNGLFIVTLNFGAAVFDGSLRSLEIGVRTNGNASAYTVLAPLQPLTATPYAVRAIMADNAAVAQANAQNFAVTNASAQIAVAVAPLVTSPVVTNIIRAQVAASGLVANLPFMTVSPAGIANGLATNKNNGLMFGPDTPGTLTGGLQEAINALLASNTNLEAPGGGKIVIGPGTVVLKAGVSVVQGPFYGGSGTNYTLVFEGAGLSASGILYAGTNKTDVLHFDAANGGEAQLFMRDLFVSSTRDMPNYLVYLNDFGKANISDCWFGYWPTMISSYGGGFSPPSVGGSSQASYLCGLFLDGGSTDDIIDVRNNDFLGLAAGIFNSSDHSVIDDNMFLYCGNYSAWQNHGAPDYHTGIGSLISFGAAIVQGHSTHENTRYHNNYFYGGNAAYVVDDSYGGGGVMVSDGDGFESQALNLIISQQSKWTQINPHGSSGVPPSKVISASYLLGGGVYTVVADDPNNYVRTILLNSDNALLNGFDTLTISGTLIVADGSGIANLQATHLIGSVPDPLISSTFLRTNGNGSRLTGITAAQTGADTNGAAAAVWMAATQYAAGLLSGGITTNIPVLVEGGGTNLLCYTNGILKAVR
jgi:hypothetical protein